MVAIERFQHTIWTLSLTLDFGLPRHLRVI